MSAGPIVEAGRDTEAVSQFDQRWGQLTHDRNLAGCCADARVGRYVRGVHVLPIPAALAVAAAIALAAQAGAEPPPQVPAVPTVPAPLNQGELLLPQHAVPSPPGTEPVARPNQNPLNNAYLLPQYADPSAPGQGQIVGVDPGEENADVSKWQYLRRLWGSYQDGGLEGGLLGQRDQDADGRPLPELPAEPGLPAG